MINRITRVRSFYRNGNFYIIPQPRYRMQELFFNLGCHQATYILSDKLVTVHHEERRDLIYHRSNEYVKS